MLFIHSLLLQITARTFPLTWFSSFCQSTSCTKCSLNLKMLAILQLHEREHTFIAAIQLHVNTCKTCGTPSMQFPWLSRNMVLLPPVQTTLSPRKNNELCTLWKFAARENWTGLGLLGFTVIHVFFSGRY